MTYPLFIPPHPLCVKPPSEWTKREAVAYRNWLCGVMDSRIKFLLTFLDEEDDGRPEELLSRVGEKISTLLADHQFSYREDRDIQLGRHSIHLKDEWQLTNEGYAIAADVGLLVAALLLRSAGDRIQWTVVRRSKMDIDYSMPVLGPFGPSMPLEPVRVSISNALAVLNGDRTPDVWTNLYLHCVSCAGQRSE